jgi:hypothetical protein
MKEKVVQILVQKGGYKRSPGILRVVDTDFGPDFDAVLVGPGEQGCLVLVIEHNEIPPAAITRRVRSFALVLDRSGSRRPLTVILIARTPSKFEALERLCRVVVITPDDDVENSLRGLLPLRVRSHEQTLNAAQDAPISNLGESIKNSLTAGLLKAAPNGPESVQKEILRAISAAIDRSR